MSNTNTAAMAVNTQALDFFEPAREHFRKLASDEVFRKEVRFAAMIFAQSEYLRKTTPESQLQALMSVATSGLTLDPARKELYLVPRKGKCVLDPSYIGMMKALTDSGSIVSGEARWIYEGDDCALDLSSDKKVQYHIPYFMRSQPKGKLIAVYSLCVLPGGGKHFEVMTKEDVDGIMNRSESIKSGGFSPWKTDYEQMGLKTVIKRHWKFLPKSAKGEAIAKVIELDNHDFEVENARSRTQVGPAALTEDQQTQVELMAEVREAFKVYKGKDKAALKKEMADEANTNKINLKFWEEMLFKLTPETVEPTQDPA